MALLYTSLIKSNILLKEKNEKLLKIILKIQISRMSRVSLGVICIIEWTWLFPWYVVAGAEYCDCGVGE